MLAWPNKGHDYFCVSTVHPITGVLFSCLSPHDCPMMAPCFYPGRQKVVREIRVLPEAPEQASADISLAIIWLPGRREGGYVFPTFVEEICKKGPAS